MSRISRWLTGSGEETPQEPAQAPPSVSAVTRMQTERLAAFATREGTRINPPAPPGGAGQAGPATAFVGDLRVEGRAPFPEGLAVRGTLELAENALLEGPLEVEGDLVLGKSARIPFPVTVLGNLIMGAGSAVSAARVAGDAFLAANATVDGELSCTRLVLPPPDPSAAARGREGGA